MSAAEIVDIAGKLFAMWALGFGVGWTVSIYRQAATHI